jgi:hypothetical protein
MLPGMGIFACSSCVQNGVARPVALKEISNLKIAPWGEEEVKSLRAYQESELFLPFLCEQNHILEVSQRGLLCFHCHTLQVWAYPWTLDWSWIDPNDAAGKAVRNPPPTPWKETAVALDLPEPDENATED